MSVRAVYLVFVFLLLVSLYSDSAAQGFGIGAGIGASFPVQEFSDRYTSGISSHIVVEYAVMGAISVTLSSGYTKWTVQDGLGRSLLHDAQVPGTLELTGNMTAIPILLGIRYYSLGSYGHSYLGLATGQFLMHGKTHVRFDDPNIFAPVTISTDESWSSAGFSIEAGSHFALSDDWGLLFRLEYMNVLDLEHKLIPAGQGIPVSVSQTQARSISVTIGIEYK